MFAISQNQMHSPTYQQQPLRMTNKTDTAAGVLKQAADVTADNFG